MFCLRSLCSGVTILNAISLVNGFKFFMLVFLFWWHYKHMSSLCLKWHLQYVMTPSCGFFFKGTKKYSLLENFKISLINNLSIQLEFNRLNSSFLYSEKSGHVISDAPAVIHFGSFNVTNPPVRWVPTICTITSSCWQSAAVASHYSLGLPASSTFPSYFISNRRLFLLSPPVFPISFLFSLR